jgi:hypothetical protein
MVTQPVPSERPAKAVRTSKEAVCAIYGDTRTREGKAASASQGEGSDAGNRNSVLVYMHPSGNRCRSGVPFRFILAATGTIPDSYEPSARPQYFSFRYCDGPSMAAHDIH